jgi:SAM-dependent methyltransferase
VSEFTGERVIPGLVEDDLWAEHIARYAFAARLAAGCRVLDLGCGTGYGTAELAKHATEAVGVDVAPEAIEYASAHYRTARYFQTPATDLPFADASFDLITCFELIEHLSDWRTLLKEAQRVVHPAGLFVVSTPNKLYYAEARGASGPNPFHAHEFEHAEFAAALREVFPHVQLLLQDRLEAFAIYAAAGAGRAQILRATADPAASNFFIAVCSQEPLPDFEPYVYVPAATNLLRERESHIHKLEAELTQVRTWLHDTTSARDQLLTAHTALEQETDEKTQWAKELESLLTAAQARVVELQEQYATQQAEATRSMDSLNAELRKHVEWALETGHKLAERGAELAKTVTLLDRAEATVIERTNWAQSLSTELDSARAQLESVRQSRWVRLGNVAGMGPDIE